MLIRKKKCENRIGSIELHLVGTLNITNVHYSSVIVIIIIIIIIIIYIALFV